MNDVLALDIGGTKLATAVVGTDGAVQGLQVEPTHAEQGRQRVLERLFAMGRRSIASRTTRIGAVGIACGGPLDPASGIVHAPLHLPDWRDVPVGPLAAEAFGVPFAMHNDATASALGEYRFGARRGVDTMLYLTISTGIGGGAVLHGQPYAGVAGNGTEFGHVTAVRDGRPCSCGRRGCIEAYASGTTIAMRAREALAAGRDSSLAALDAITAAEVVEAAAAGDRLAAEVWDETTALLGAVVTDLANVFEPDLVVLGGGVSGAGARLIDPIRDIVRREAFRPTASVVRVRLAALGELVGVVGAGVIAQDVLDASSDPRRVPIAAHVTAARHMPELDHAVRTVADLLCDTFARGGVADTLGNGGSAAEAEHLAGELIGHYRLDRRPLASVALTVDPATVTCIANDYSYDEVFAHQVTALVRPTDVVIAFTTSGRSPNVVAALAAARRAGATTVLVAGTDGGPAARFADHALLVPSTEPPRIQELHTLVVHLISDVVDAWAAQREEVP